MVNVLPGAPEAGAALVSHPLVKKVTFTGGPDTAKKILHSCADAMKPACLELGGKSANIIFDDANLDIACAHGTFMSVAVLSGQGCALPTRMLVHEPVYDQVVGRVAEIAKTITVGDPLKETIVSGPVVSRAALDRIMAMIEQARLDGARLVTGGARLGGPLADGCFIEPTVFAGRPAVEPRPAGSLRAGAGHHAVPHRGGCHRDRQQHRVRAFRVHPDQRPAPGTPARRRTGHRRGTGQRAVNLGVHRPFGGVGLSGFGKEGGRAGLEEFLQVKSVAIV